MTVTETSMLAYSKVLENLGERHVQVYKAFLELGSATNEMVAQHLGIAINRVTGRTNELRFQKHVLTLVKKDICPVTKGLAQWFRVRKKL